jgi:hypothetical protein
MSATYSLGTDPVACPKPDQSWLRHCSSDCSSHLLLAAGKISDFFSATHLDEQGVLV